MIYDIKTKASTMRPICRQCKLPLDIVIKAKQPYPISYQASIKALSLSYMIDTHQLKMIKKDYGYYCSIGYHPYDSPAIPNVSRVKVLSLSQRR